tara:strand:+ start:174 stop:638 length:465 start_codon:yes stop_codon:yes gene_type:complete
MPAGRHDINAEQGVTFKLHLNYKDSTTNLVDLATYSARMQVRRSPEDSDLLLFVTGSTMNNSTGVVHSGSLTGGGATGDFSIGSGVAGVGDLKLNSNADGSTNGGTGGILISMDATSMANCPKGNHFYDLEIISGTDVTRLIEGRFSVDREITR